MKTSELIKKLNELDPDDECAVCVNNHPIQTIVRVPWYYDGRLQYIERNKHGTPIKVGYKSVPIQKITIFTDCIEDALMNNPDAELELSGITYDDNEVNSRYMDYLKKCIKNGKEFQQKILNAPPPKFSFRKLIAWLKD